MQKRYKPAMSAVMVLMSSWWFMAGVVFADDHLPSDCETARDRAKSKYGAVRHYFDTFNLCMTRADGDLAQCEQALNHQQGALGDFIFAQRVAQDVCGREGLSGEMVR
jgi:hypothetical protein